MGIWFLSLLINSGCNRDLVEYDSNDLKISIEKGEEWLHNFPLFLGINIKNPPQIAIWTEDMEGNYLSTVYVTHKIATQSWQASGGNRRIHLNQPGQTLGRNPPKGSAAALVLSTGNPI